MSRICPGCNKEFASNGSYRVHKFRFHREAEIPGDNTKTITDNARDNGITEAEEDGADEPDTETGNAHLRSFVIGSIIGVSIAALLMFFGIVKNDTFIPAENTSPREPGRQKSFLGFLYDN